MSIQIEKDPEGNPYFRQVRIPIGVGNTTVRVVDTEAGEVAERIMDIDLGPHIADLNASGKVFKSEWEFRVAVVESAVGQIRSERQHERMKNAPLYSADGMSA